MGIKYILTLIKGIAMGAADVVPGVSGGTIAFITGIYGELIGSIKSVDGKAFKLLLTFRFREFWKKINGNFLASVVLGIGISIFSLARLMTWLLAAYPIQVWSFFFGLIIASTLLVGKSIKKWNVGAVASFLIAAAVSYTITVVSPATTPETWWFIMFSGALAICAMILPGISGAFILLLLGKYQFMMAAVGDLQIGIILLFVAGAIIGIISFSHLLSWLLEKYNTVTIAALTGFMAGSLNKVWPWKQTITWYEDSHGAAHPLTESNVLSGSYVEIYGLEAHTVQAIALCIAGFALIWVVEYAGRRIKTAGDAG